MVTIASLNVNGIRAAVKERSDTNKGLLEWLRSTPAEIICLQEVRADPRQTEAAIAPALAEGWHWIGADSQVKGRSGVGILSRYPFHNHRIGFPSQISGATEFDKAGRYIETEILIPHQDGTQEITLASVYIPAGEAGTPKQVEKERFTQILLEHMTTLAQHDKPVLLCGDWNIAHTEFDIKNAKGNIKNSGFLPEERAWFSQILSKHWTDITRHLIPDEHGPYSWWSPRGQAFDTDTGWRIDYHIGNQHFTTAAQKTWVDKAKSYAERWSDHAPVLTEYQFS